MKGWTWAKARMTFGCAATLCAVIAVQALAVSGISAEPVHGLSSFGDLKYKPGFPHFDYVDAKAPKGGTKHQCNSIAETRIFESGHSGT